MSRSETGQRDKGVGNGSCTIVVCSVFNYCWWKGHFVGRTSERGISESDFLVLGCLTKSACNPLENFAAWAFPDHWLSSELKMAHSAGRKVPRVEMRRVYRLYFNLIICFQYQEKYEAPQVWSWLAVSLLISCRDCLKQWLGTVSIHWMHKCT